MRKIALPALFLSLLCFAFTAQARESYVPIAQRLSPEQLREVGLTPAQLELLDRMLREADGRVAAQVARDADAEQDGARDGSAHYIGLDDAPIRSRLKGEVSGWEPGTVFELENGQQWKVLKGRMKLRKALSAPEIVVVPGIAGRWFLQVDEDLPKARVYRID